MRVKLVFSGSPAFASFKHHAALILFGFTADKPGGPHISSSKGSRSLIGISPGSSTSALRRGPLTVTSNVCIIFAQSNQELQRNCAAPSYRPDFIASNSLSSFPYIVPSPTRASARPPHPHQPIPLPLPLRRTLWSPFVFLAGRCNVGHWGGAGGGAGKGGGLALALST